MMELQKVHFAFQSLKKIHHGPYEANYATQDLVYLHRVDLVFTVSKDPSGKK